MSSTTRRQREEFAKQFQPIGDILDTAIDWISVNLAPGDVFGDTTLEEWAEENGYVKEGK